MRFRINIEPEKEKGEIILPINYQYELSSYVYHTLNKGNQNLAAWLHERGFMKENRSFKMFTFSKLNIPKIKRFEDRLIILSDTAYFDLSFFPAELSESFITGLFRDQNFSIGDRRSKVSFRVRGVERLKDPEFGSKMCFTTTSPVVVTMRDQEKHRYPQYLAPGHEDYSERIKNNLVNKIMAFHNHYETDDTNNNYEDLNIKVLSPAKPRLISIKANTKDEIKVKGFHYTFEVSGSPELIKTGYFAGFGEKNAIGFGCVQATSETT